MNEAVSHREQGDRQEDLRDHHDDPKAEIRSVHRNPEGAVDDVKDRNKGQDEGNAFVKEGVFLFARANRKVDDGTKQQEEHDEENRVGDEPEVEGKKEEGEE